MKVLAEKSDIGLWVGIVCGEDGAPGVGEIVARNRDPAKLREELDAKREQIQKKYPGTLITVGRVPDPDQVMAPITLSGPPGNARAGQPAPGS